MIVIGVTGGVGTGKSTVARMFGKLGATVLDADRITHDLMKPGTPVWRKLRKRFGKEVCTDRGRIDRRRLGEEVFQDSHRLKALTRIIHPAVRRRIQERIRRIRTRSRSPVVVLDVPLLMEADAAYRCDARVVVSAPFASVARHLKARSGWGPAQIRERMKHQMPLRAKEKKADFVVKNGGSLVAARSQVLNVWKKVMLRHAGGS